MKIKFLDMQKEVNPILNNQSFSMILIELANTINTGHYLFGSRHYALENKLSNLLNAEVVLVGSGTDAIALSLKAAGVQPGDKVIVPAFSAIPTAVAVKMIGAEPFYVDVDEDGSLNLEIVKNIITYNKIKAIVPVHLYGQPVNMEELINICEDKLIIVEDCAQSFGSTINNIYTGNFGTAGAHSFYPTKNLGCYGDGGAVVTSNSSIASKVRELRFYGQKSNYIMGDSIGMNSRMDELQCTVLLEKIQTIKEKNNIRKQMSNKYKSRLKESLNVKLINWTDGAVPHIFPIRVANRCEFQKYMDGAGIETIIHYPFTLPSAINKDCKNLYPCAKEWSKTVVSIPFNPWLTEYEQDYILDTVLEWQ